VGTQELRKEAAHGQTSTGGGRYHRPSMRISKKLSALGAFFVIAAVVAGCGSSIAGNSVATVAGNPISLQAYNHWTYIAAVESAAQQTGEPVIVPKSPPKYTSCIAQIRRDVPSLKTTPDSTLKTDCAEVFKEYNSEVMQFLIEAYWYQADAYKLGIKYTTADLNRDFSKAIKTEFKTKAALATYLKSAGETEADIRFQVRVSQIYSKLLKRDEVKVNAASIAKYYAAHESEFGTKETRDLHLVRTTSLAKAKAAYSALKSGESWTVVAKKYSASAAAAKNGGLLTGVSTGEEEAAVNAAIFKNPVGKIVGPIHGLLGSYVIEVTKITAATQKTLAQATSEIKTLITDQQQTAAETKVNNESKKNWGSQTLCRSTYSISDCVGYKAPATTTTATPTTTTTVPSTTGTVTATTPTSTSTTTTTS
jgi:parvulin-like peptidyl-prolyl isomerase